MLETRMRCDLLQCSPTTKKLVPISGPISGQTAPTPPLRGQSDSWKVHHDLRDGQLEMSESVKPHTSTTIQDFFLE